MLRGLPCRKRVVSKEADLAKILARLKAQIPKITWRADLTPFLKPPHPYPTLTHPSLGLPTPPQPFSIHSSDILIFCTLFQTFSPFNKHFYLFPVIFLTSYLFPRPPHLVPSIFHMFPTFCPRFPASSHHSPAINTAIDVSWCYRTSFLPLIHLSLSLFLLPSRGHRLFPFCQLVPSTCSPVMFPAALIIFSVTFLFPLPFPFSYPPPLPRLSFFASLLSLLSICLPFPSPFLLFCGLPFPAFPFRSNSLSVFIFLLLFRLSPFLFSLFPPFYSFFLPPTLPFPSFLTFSLFFLFFSPVYPPFPFLCLPILPAQMQPGNSLWSSQLK